MKINLRWLGSLLSLIFACTSVQLLAQNTSDQSKLNQAMKEQIKVGDKSAKSQEKISSLSSKEKDLYAEYKAVERQIENTKIYNEQMRKLIKSQEEEMVTMKAQIEDLKNTNKQILPLMEKMTGTLDQFVSLDIPFLPEEREGRVTQLKGMLNKANVSTSEKFRRILEAYQIENEYGRTIETYRGKMAMGDKETTVDFLRLGRTALYYQTLDREQTYAWSRVKKQWTKLDDDTTGPVLRGIKIAQKQLTPNLIGLPIEKTGVTK